MLPFILMTATANTPECPGSDCSEAPSATQELGGFSFADKNYDSKEDMTAYTHVLSVGIGYRAPGRMDYPSDVLSVSYRRYTSPFVSVGATVRGSVANGAVGTGGLIDVVPRGTGAHGFHIGTEVSGMTAAIARRKRGEDEVVVIAPITEAVSDPEDVDALLQEWKRRRNWRTWTATWQETRARR